MAEYTKEQIKQIVKDYTLTQKQYEKVIETVIAVMSQDKIPSNNPLAIIVGGQSGAGKTALIDYTSAISSKREFVTIDNDFFRAFHPDAAEIKKIYPALYTQCTDQIGLGITADVISYFMGNNVVLESGKIIENPNNVRYDLIFHQTLKSNRIADDAMAKLKNAGYTVGVRAFAVPYMESKMSQMERCKAQYDNMGFCRHVRPEDHFSALRGIPNTIDYIQQNSKTDFIEIFKRSDDIRNPQLVYSWINPTEEEKTLNALKDCEKVSHETNESGFINAKDAVLKTWEQETIECAKTLDKRLSDLKGNGGEEIPGMKEHVVELEKYQQEYNQDPNLLFPGQEQ